MIAVMVFSVLWSVLEAFVPLAPEEVMTHEVRGKDLLSGRPKAITVNSDEIREALADPVQVILGAVQRAMDKTPPELAADIGKDGITLAGGGALLRGLDKLIAKDSGLPVTITEDPLTSVAVGTGIAMENINEYQKVFIN